MSVERGGKHVYINGHTGHQTTPYEKRNELAELHLGTAAFIGEYVITLCPVCFGPMTHNGSSLDHIVSRGQLIADLAMSEEDANTKVGHVSNILQACTGCNSSKQNKDLFEWWQSDLSKSYLTPTNRDRVLAVLAEIYTNTAKARMSHFTFGTYKTIVLQIQKRVIG